MSKALKVSLSLLRKQKSDLDIGLENHTEDEEYLRQGWEIFFLSSQLPPVLWIWSDQIFLTGWIQIRILYFSWQDKISNYITENYYYFVKSYFYFKDRIRIWFHSEVGPGSSLFRTVSATLVHGLTLDFNVFLLSKI